MTIGGQALAQPSGQFEAVDARDVQIDHDQVGTDLECPFERLQPVVSLLDVEPGTAQPLGVQTTALEVVFDEPNNEARSVEQDVPHREYTLSAQRAAAGAGPACGDGEGMNQGSFSTCPGLI